MEGHGGVEGETRAEYEVRREREALWGAQEGLKERVERRAEKGGTLNGDWFLNYVTKGLRWAPKSASMHMLPCNLLCRRPVENRAMYQTPTAQRESVIHLECLSLLCALGHLSLSLSLSLSLTSRLFISNLVRSRCISSVSIKLVLFPLLLQCAGLFAGPEIYSLFLIAYSSCYSKSIELHSAGVAISGKMSSSVHGYLHLPDNIMWISALHQPETRQHVGKKHGWWLGLMCGMRVDVHLILLLIVQLLCEQGIQIG